MNEPITALGQQMLIGSAVIGLTLVVHAGFIATALTAYSRAEPSPRWRASFLVAATTLTLTGLWMALAHTISIILWTYVLVASGALTPVADALYFTLVCYTTLGQGGLTPDPSWRLAPGLIAANGFLLFGLTAGIAADFMVRLRVRG